MSQGDPQTPNPDAGNGALPGQSTVVASEADLLAQIEKLKQKNAELESESFATREEKRKAKEQQRQLEDEQRKALEAQGKFEELAKANERRIAEMQAEREAMMAEVNAVKTQASRASEYEAMAKARVDTLFSKLDATAQSQLKALFPEWDGSTSIEQERRLNAFMEVRGVKTPPPPPGGAANGATGIGAPDRYAEAQKRGDLRGMIASKFNF